MAETFSGTFKLALSGTFASDANELAAPSQAFNYSKSQVFTNGTGADQANMIFSDQRTIGASPDDLDLSGSLSNAFGTTISFTAIKGIIVFAASANSGNVTLGGDGSAAFINWVSDSSDSIVIKPGGMFALIDPSAGGYGVTNSTADVLQVAGTQNDIYDIILIGEV